MPAGTLKSTREKRKEKREKRKENREQRTGNREQRTHSRLLLLSNCGARLD
jgi:hypothetical protein